MVHSDINITHVKKWVYHENKYGCNFLQIRNELIAYRMYVVERKIGFEQLFMEVFSPPQDAMFLYLCHNII